MHLDDSRANVQWYVCEEASKVTSSTQLVQKWWCGVVNVLAPALWFDKAVPLCCTVCLQDVHKTFLENTLPSIFAPTCWKQISIFIKNFN